MVRITPFLFSASVYSTFYHISRPLVELVSKCHEDESAVVTGNTVAWGAIADAWRKFREAADGLADVHPQIVSEGNIFCAWASHETRFTFTTFIVNNISSFLSSIAYRTHGIFPTHTRERDSVVRIATGYGLDDREVGVRVTVGLIIFYSPHRPDLL
jgi:hypothetical protein